MGTASGDCEAQGIDGGAVGAGAAGVVSEAEQTTKRQVGGDDDTNVIKADARTKKFAQRHTCKVCSALSVDRPTKHERECVQVMMTVHGAPEGLTSDGVPMDHVVGGMSRELEGMFLKVAGQVQRIYTEAGHERGVRPQHQGVLYGVGWQKRYQQWYGPQEVAQGVTALVKPLAEAMLKHAVAKLFVDCQENQWKERETAWNKLGRRVCWQALQCSEAKSRKYIT